MMKVFLDSIGCRLNQSEIERMALQLRRAGQILVATPEESDLVIINTCSVTTAAAADSRSKIRSTHRRNHHTQIVLTGCWSDLEPTAAAALPGVIQVVPNERKDTLIPHILNLPDSDFSLELPERKPIPGVRKRTRSFIKVQDGCDNRCKYCVTTIARGSARSQPIERVIAEIRSATAGGAKEVVLTGAQLSAYGRDLPNHIVLTNLIQAILAETEIPRIRLSSLEPWGLTDGLLSIMQEKRLCRQLHLPLQSGCDHTLRRMGRPIRSEEYACIIVKARKAIPGLAVTTDIMVGFPGETEDEFTESLAFIDAMAFSRAHVFIYSPRPGTAAAQLPDQVSLKAARRRSQLVRSVVNNSGYAFRTGFLGQVMTVLWESVNASGPQEWELSGLTDNYLRVHAYSDQNLTNHLTDVLLLAMEGETMRGELALQERRSAI